MKCVREKERKKERKKEKKQCINGQEKKSRKETKMDQRSTGRSW